MSDPNWIPVCRLDYQLVDEGAWPSPLGEKLRAWANVGDFRERRMLSSSLVPEIIKTLLGNDLTSAGQRRAKLLGDELVHFEDLIITTRTGLRRRFYRDHLNHMIRVCILAKAFGERLDLSEMTPSRKRLLALVGLMHDIAYPLAEAGKILQTTVRSMEKSYETVSFTDSSPKYNVGLLLARLRRIAPSESWQESLAEYLEASEHFIMGAIEFLGYVDEGIGGVKGRDFTNAARAIAFHDNQIDTILKYSENPILVQLILCDELQEWGRPAEFQRGPISPVIPELLDFQLERNRIACRIDFGSIESHLGKPLTQTWAKWTNVSRIDFDKRFPELKIEVELSNYIQINLSRVESALYEFFRSRKNWGALGVANFTAFLHGLDKTSGFPFAAGSYLDRSVLNKDVTRFLPLTWRGSVKVSRMSDLFLRYTGKPQPQVWPQQTLSFDLDRAEGLVVHLQGIPKSINFTKSAKQNRIKLHLTVEDPPGSRKSLGGSIVKNAKNFPIRLATMIGGIGAAMVLGDLKNNQNLRRQVVRTGAASLKAGGIPYTPSFDSQTIADLLGVTRVEAETVSNLWENRRAIVDGTFFRWDPS